MWLSFRSVMKEVPKGVFHMLNFNCLCSDCRFRIRSPWAVGQSNMGRFSPVLSCATLKPTSTLQFMMTRWEPSSFLRGKKDFGGCSWGNVVGKNQQCDISGWKCGHTGDVSSFCAEHHDLSTFKHRRFLVPCAYTPSGWVIFPGAAWVTFPAARSWCWNGYHNSHPHRCFFALVS